MDRSQAWLPIAVGLFVVAFVLNAWVVDDAYITFRTVDNFVSGHGLTWNVGERVQVYTHPLWMFVVSACYAVTGDVFFTSIALSLALCLAAFASFARAWRRSGGREAWRVPLLLLLVIASKATMDYSASGLETALSYFLAALFLGRLLFVDPSLRELSLADIRFLFFIAALACFNRLDHLLLYLPALTALLALQAPRLGWRVAPAIVLATLPATLWVLFALFYYGSPFPNTAFAKVFGPGIPESERLERGVAYLLNSLSWDLASHLAVVGAAGLALWRRSLAGAVAMAGVALQLAFVVGGGAAATHLSGRYFATTFFFSMLVLVRLVPGPRTGALVAAVAAAQLLLSPVSSLRKDTRWYRLQERGPAAASHIDANSHRFRRGVALVDVFDRERGPLPRHAGYLAGLEFRRHPSPLSIGGAGGWGAIGYFGFAAGPEKTIVDYLGLADPLLARLPTCSNPRPGKWTSGHFYRSLPEGYLASILSGRNQLRDPGLAQYYDVIRRIARGPLGSWERIGSIVAMNLGRYDRLLEGYAQRNAEAFSEHPCNKEVRAGAGVVPMAVVRQYRRERPG